ncbi:MAG: P-II family nitrogen regulator [Clostridiales bacterium]|nr:P-II family nitrogen regulator [Clostridiales bacterium]
MTENNELQFELIFCIINEGFAETVMDAAKEVGAKGGTVFKAHGTANPESEKFFHINVHPEKEVLMILVKKDIKDAVLHAIYKSGGLNTEGQGIAFSMPVESVVGIEKSKN